MNNFFYHDGVFSVLETYDGDIFRVQTKKAEESARKMGISEYQCILFKGTVDIAYKETKDTYLTWSGFVKKYKSVSKFVGERTEEFLDILQTMPNHILKSPSALIETLEEEGGSGPP